MKSEYDAVEIEKIQSQLSNYNFYHIIQVLEGVYTQGRENLVPVQQVPLNMLRTVDLTGKRVLDIGCRDGLFSFEAERLNAKEIIGIDNDLSRGAIEFLIPHFQSQVQMHEMNLFDLHPDRFGVFDFILFVGVLYHLRYPFWALRLIRDVLSENGYLLIETGIYIDENQKAILFCPIGSESPYEPSSCTFFNLKGLTDTLFSLGLIVEKVELLNTGEVLLEEMSTVTYTIRATQEQVTQLAPPKIHLKNPKVGKIDRATLLCRKASEIEDTDISRYWNSTHLRHTQERFYTT
jgi:2-polyprenyl-3-methyl-5-hydroxy-6-metoxy-1,4-benzoquinol methylase